MNKLSRTAWIAIAAAAAGIPATLAIAKQMDGRGWHRASPETRARLDEGKIAMAKAALKLTPEQEKLFAPVEEQVRDAFKAREAKRVEMDKKREERRAERQARRESGERGDGPSSDRKRPDLAERFEKMSERMTERAERMKAFAGAFKPFYASLSDEQKDVLRPLMRDIAPGFGRGGGKGHRWANGGWGPGGRDHGWHRDHGGRGGDGPRNAGEAAPEQGPQGEAPDEAAPPAPETP